MRKYKVDKFYSFSRIILIVLILCFVIIASSASLRFDYYGYFVQHYIPVPNDKHFTNKDITITFTTENTTFSVYDSSGTLHYNAFFETDSVIFSFQPMSALVDNNQNHPVKSIILKGGKNILHIIKTKHILSPR